MKGKFSRYAGIAGSKALLKRLVSGKYNNLNVPAWAIRLVLQKDEIDGMPEDRGDGTSG